MNAEYFAPREDVILQNEAPSDFYILVTGSVVKNKQKRTHCFLFSRLVRGYCILIDILSGTTTKWSLNKQEMTLTSDDALTGADRAPERFRAGKSFSLLQACIRS